MKNATQNTATEARVLGHEHLELLSVADQKAAVEKQIPIFMCERNERGGLTFHCPHCNRKHHHKARNGHRRPHCFKQPPVYENGYFVAAAAPSAANEAEQAELASQVVVAERIHRTQLKSFLESRGGKLAGIDFIKLDGKRRALVGRLGVKALSKGGKNTVEAVDRPYLTVFDMAVKGYRTVNLATVYRVRADGRVYDILD